MKNLINIFWYLYKRNNWILDTTRLWKNFEDIKIDRPIFFLGTHGGGTTLVSRIIRRNKNIISVSGNYKYWSGADEMHAVLGPILPFEFSGIRHKVPNNPISENHTSWLYASDELIKYYRLIEKDVTSELEKKFKNIIKWLIYRHAVNEDNARFTDKSQSYTVKVSFINEILKDSTPKFILITRNPYALCYRAPFKAAGLLRIGNKFTFEELLNFASQHWANSMKYALGDGEKVKNFLTARFEDVLREPEKNIKKICDFCELEFNEDMLPQPRHKIPFGSRYNNKWYPLRTNVNESYLKEISKKHINIIDKYCREYAQIFGYERPKK